MYLTRHMVCLISDSWNLSIRSFLFLFYMGTEAQKLVNLPKVMQLGSGGAETGTWTQDSSNSRVHTVLPEDTSRIFCFSDLSCSVSFPIYSWCSRNIYWVKLNTHIQRFSHYIFFQSTGVLTVYAAHPKHFPFLYTVTRYLWTTFSLPVNI